MGETHFVVIGNGPAGYQAAMTLRERASGAGVTIVGKDRDSGYRPHRLPDFVAAELPEEELFFSPAPEYKAHGIKLRRGQEVLRLDLQERFLVLDHRERLPFSGLIIAAGGRPRIPEPFRPFRDLLLTLKTLEDARTWRERLCGAAAVLLIGGDFTSFAFARTLLRLGKQVHFLLDEGAFWPLRFDESRFQEAERSLRRRGVEVWPRTCIQELSRRPDGRLRAAFAQGELHVDLIGAFFGLVPDVRFLSDSGLRIDRGILVDEFLNTGFEGVFATGDCAQIYHPALRDYWISIGYENACNLGRIAALNLLGERRPAEVDHQSIFCDRGVNVNTSWWTEF